MRSRRCGTSTRWRLRALEAAQSGAKVLVVRNTVDYAIRTQEALLEITGPQDADLLFSVGDHTHAAPRTFRGC